MLFIIVLCYFFNLFVGILDDAKMESGIIGSTGRKPCGKSGFVVICNSRITGDGDIAGNPGHRKWLV